VFSEWHLVDKVPWTPEAHLHFPRLFKEQTVALLLVCQRLQLSSFVAILPQCFMPVFWDIVVAWGVENIYRFMPRNRILIQGLKNAAENNGKRGIVMSEFNEVSGRYRVRINETGQMINIKPANMTGACHEGEEAMREREEETFE
jgi:hypothetical protein